MDPKVLCRNHLLGEHNEIHKLVGSIENGQSIEGYVEKNQVDTSKIQRRHEELVKEMKRRGYNHQSPLRYQDQLNQGHVDPKSNLSELQEKCGECRKRITKKSLS